MPYYNSIPIPIRSKARLDEEKHIREVAHEGLKFSNFTEEPSFCEKYLKWIIIGVAIAATIALVVVFVI